MNFLFKNLNYKLLAIILPPTVALIVGYWASVYKPAHSGQTVDYTGRVIDANTKQEIAGARVSVEANGPPQVCFTDTYGIFHLKLSAGDSATSIRVAASGYEIFDQNVNLSNPRLEDVRLTRLPNTSPTPAPAISPTVTSTVTPTATPPNASIRITLIPPYDPFGGPNVLTDIAGKVSGAYPADSSVVIYAYTGDWYVQPTTAEPATRIEDDGTWSTPTHRGAKYAALLVRNTFKAGNKISALPGVGGDVIARQIVEGKK